MHAPKVRPWLLTYVIEWARVLFNAFTALTIIKFCAEPYFLISSTPSCADKLVFKKTLCSLHIFNFLRCPTFNPAWKADSCFINDKLEESILQCWYTRILKLQLQDYVLLKLKFSLSKGLSLCFICSAQHVTYSGFSLTSICLLDCHAKQYTRIILMIIKILLHVTKFWFDWTAYHHYQNYFPVIYISKKNLNFLNIFLLYLQLLLMLLFLKYFR